MVPLEDATTPESITDAIRRFCKTIDHTREPLFVPVEPKDNCVRNECFKNTEVYQKEHGGTIQYGWIIWETPGILLEAEFHAMWVSPDGRLVDITPKVDRETQVLFLPDSKRKYERKLVDSIRQPLVDSPETRRMIESAEMLFRIKQRHYNEGRIDWEGVNADIERYVRQQAQKKYLQHPTPGRNAPCPCGSGKKYKKCCGK